MTPLSWYARTSAARFAKVSYVGDQPIESYGIIGDLHTAALVSKEGSIDWLCLPRFDSGACFASLVGHQDNGYWQIRPAGQILDGHHTYLDRSLVLATYFETATGVVRVIDFMPPRNSHPTIHRIIEGVQGQVEMEMAIKVRFDYGKSVPWVRREGEHLYMVLGPNALLIGSTMKLSGKDFSTRAAFTVSEGQRHSVSMVFYDSTSPVPHMHDPSEALEACLNFWHGYMRRCNEHCGEYQELVERSIITLKALTYGPSGGIVAAPTTSLPEEVGGVRNWDYRYCWLRDAAFTLDALLVDGFEREAAAWIKWLIRAAAGDPTQLQIMYGIGGERLIPEYSLKWLPGYLGSSPVRVGNAASEQFQLDVYGELLDSFYRFQCSGIEPLEDFWPLLTAVVEYVEGHWNEPDEGIWEVRGPRRHFTYSKVMAWVVFDRAVKLIEEYGARGPLKRWTKVRDEIRDSVLSRGFHEDAGTFVQDYDSDRLDASLLRLSLVGFVDAADPRMVATVEAIDQRLSSGGLIKRYETGEADTDGLPGREGVFLACSFWLVDNLVLQGRFHEAKSRFDELLTLGNELGLFSEEYDPLTHRMLGNFPQALTHVGLINTARYLVENAPPGYFPEARPPVRRTAGKPRTARATRA